MFSIPRLLAVCFPRKAAISTPFRTNYLTRVRALSVRVHSKAIARAPRHPCARRASLFLCLTRRESPRHPLRPSLSRPVRCVNRLFQPPTFCPRDTLADYAARRGATRAGMPRAARRRISVIATTRDAREEKVTWVIWPFRTRACARLTWCVSRHGDPGESAAV